jgi:hypothetical protein
MGKFFCSAQTQNFNSAVRCRGMPPEYFAGEESAPVDAMGACKKGWALVSASEMNTKGQGRCKRLVKNAFEDAEDTKAGIKYQDGTTWSSGPLVTGASRLSYCPPGAPFATANGKDGTLGCRSVKQLQSELLAEMSKNVE